MCDWPRLYEREREAEGDEEGSGAGEEGCGGRAEGCAEEHGVCVVEVAIETSIYISMLNKKAVSRTQSRAVADRKPPIPVHDVQAVPGMTGSIDQPGTEASLDYCLASRLPRKSLEYLLHLHLTPIQRGCTVSAEYLDLQCSGKPHIRDPIRRFCHGSKQELLEVALLCRPAVK
jgi:hypothetical protein